MTVANTNVSSSYNCNGVTREFNIGFHYNSTLSGLSIVVKHADGTSTTVSANYEIEDNVLTYPTLESELDPLPEGDVITISRVTPLTQSINLVQQGPLDAEVLEGGYDKAALQIQEVASKKQDKLIAGENIVIDEDGTISATGEVVEGVNWGNIHGTLSNQTDLLTALNAKADSSDLNSYVAKTGSTMTGNLTMSNGSRVILSNTSNNSYNVFSHETSGGVKQLHLMDTTTGTGVLLDAANSNKPFYVDGSNAYRLLDTSDKTTLENSIAGKANTDLSNSTVPHIVQFTHSGADFCRVWSDGWCEQGGYSTTGSVTFHKAMADTNYHISITQYRNGADSSGDYRYITAYSTTGITQALDTNGSFFWKVEGFAAEEE